MVSLTCRLRWGEASAASRSQGLGLTAGTPLSLLSIDLACRGWAGPILTPPTLGVAPAGSQHLWAGVQMSADPASAPGSHRAQPAAFQSSAKGCSRQGDPLAPAPPTPTLLGSAGRLGSGFPEHRRGGASCRGSATPPPRTPTAGAENENKPCKALISELPAAAVITGFAPPRCGGPQLAGPPWRRPPRASPHLRRAPSPPQRCPCEAADPDPDPKAAASLARGQATAPDRGRAARSALGPGALTSAPRPGLEAQRPPRFLLDPRDTEARSSGEAQGRSALSGGSEGGGAQVGRGPGATYGEHLQRRPMGQPDPAARPGEKVPEGRPRPLFQEGGGGGGRGFLRGRVGGGCDHHRAGHIVEGGYSG